MPTPSARLLNLRTQITQHLLDILSTISSTCPRQLGLHQIEKLMSLVPMLYLCRARVHEKLGYADLASADAYRAVLGVERLREWVEEGREEWIDARDGGDGEAAEGEGNVDEVVLGWLELSSQVWGDEIEDIQELSETLSWNHDRTNGYESWDSKFLDLIDTLDRLSLYDLTKTLIQAGCLAPAYKYAEIGVTKIAKQDGQFKSLMEEIRRKHQGEGKAKNAPLRIRGASRREVYPWNMYEPDRYSPELLERINRDLAAISCFDTKESGREVVEMEPKTPWCEVRCVELPMLGDGEDKPQKKVKQLGVFALRDIPGGKQYSREKSAMVNCTIQGRRNEGGTGVIWICEFCTKRGVVDEGEFIVCEECEEEDVQTYYCSVECLERAKELYHPALCGRDWEWLHWEVTKVRDVPFEEFIEKRKASVNDGGDRNNDDEDLEEDSALYALLLLKAWGMALTLRKHPLELPEADYLYGAGKRRKRYLELDGHVEGAEEEDEEERDSFVPFDFHEVVVIPHRILEELGVDILPFPQSYEYEDVEEEDSPNSNMVTNGEAEYKRDKNRQNDNLSTGCPSPTLSLTHFDISTSVLNLLNKFKSVASLTRSTLTATHFPIITITIAVHPLYSLHNHVCDPNVHWSVNERGEACFTALSEEQKFWRNNDGDGKKNEWRKCWEGGVRRGEELCSSYVDPELDVVSRRNRIRVTLGGDCWCERCVREEKEREVR